MRTLLVGNTGYITNKFVEEAFPESLVMVMGDTSIRKNRKKNLFVRPFVKNEKELEDIFITYDFEQIIYFSNYLTFHGETRGEAEMLRKILQLCRGKRNMRIVYLTGPERLYDVPTGKTLLVSEMENLCREYAKLYKITVKIIRSPYLYSEQYEKDFLNTVFREISTEQKITFQEDESQRMFFMSMQDLAELMYKIFDNWDEKEEILNIADVFDHCFKDLGDKLTELCPHLKVSYARYSIMENMLKDDKIIRYKYGWFPKISILEEIPELYEHYQERNNIKAGRLDSLKHILSKYKTVVRAAEFAAFFILFELLNGIAGNQAQFKMIDLRLIFVVLFGSTYGINYGIAAAAAESLSLIRAFEAEGSSWYVLFYEPSNWIPFIFYFAVGAICGYIRMKNKDNVQFIKEENNLLQEKFLFTREMYQETIEDKNLYKKQILGSKDSFGKIFDITRKLDVIQPQELYIEIIRVLEDVLENKTFGLYTLNRENGYGRLETASAQVQGNYPNSIKLSGYSAAMEELENGNVWANREFLENYPMYMAGVRKNGELVMLICIQQASREQMSLYFLNLFKILSGLVETSLLRALEYQKAVEYRQYVKGTHILKTEYFEERLKVQHDMREQKLASYVLLKVEYSEMSLKEADEILRSKVRENDVWGISESKELYLMLVQTDKEALPNILARLKQAGLVCRQIDEELTGNNRTGENK
ncbi:MAG: nucleoside-diphosphate sugar epimerase [Clostridiales bacterium 41_12_two_minus]|nr:MAG: nucleoside-diphosphate sugar epimerase [Clostridiales bacterium 41_12_two_minus]